MRKYFYILITLAAVLSIALIGCKNKPTAMSEFIEEPESPTDATITPSGNLPNSINSSDYQGNYFISKKYYKTGNAGETFTYTVEVKKWQYQNAGTAVVFKGFENGVEFTRTYQAGTMRFGNGKFKLDKIEGDAGFDSGYILFKTDGYAHLEISGYNFTIILAKQ